MRSTLEEFQRDLSELRALAGSIAPVNTALANHGDTVVLQYLTVRRRFDYAGFIVALYASFESFVENLVVSYARQAALRARYCDLPEKLTSKHMAKSAELLQKARLGQGRLAGLRDVDIVRNLWDCLSGAMPYTLNEVAIAEHDRNLRADELDLMFRAIGIEGACGRAGKSEPLNEWFRATQGLELASPEGVPTMTIQKRLEDLVERRNQVAHRGGNPLELIGPSEMDEFTRFAEAFAKALFGLVACEYLRSRSDATKLEVVNGPLKKGSVVVIAKPATRLHLGQAVFALMAASGARWGRIRTLKVDDAPTDSVEPSSGAPEVGVEVDFRLPKKGRSTPLRLRTGWCGLPSDLPVRPLACLALRLALDLGGLHEAHMCLPCQHCLAHFQAKVDRPWPRNHEAVHRSHDSRDGALLEVHTYRAIDHRRAVERDTQPSLGRRRVVRLTIEKRRHRKPGEHEREARDGHIVHDLPHRHVGGDGVEHPGLGNEDPASRMGHGPSPSGGRAADGGGDPTCVR